MILSFDGGGVLGIWSSRILARLLEAHPSLIDDTKLIAGTSTGGLIAGALAIGKTASEVVDIYKESCPEIFHARFLGGVVGAKYKNLGLVDQVSKIFGSTLLGSVKKVLLIPTFKLKDANPLMGWGPIIFDSVNFATELLADVAIRSASAPTYFCSHQGYIDGGVAANSPSVHALALAASLMMISKDTTILSIGPGWSGTHLDGETLDWGALDWATRIAGVFMQSQPRMSNLICNRILGERFFRIESSLIGEIGMDDVGSMDKLISLADAFDLTAVSSWLTGLGYV